MKKMTTPPAQCATFGFLLLFWNMGLFSILLKIK